MLLCILKLPSRDKTFGSTACTAWLSEGKQLAFVLLPSSLVLRLTPPPPSPPTPCRMVMGKLASCGWKHWGILRRTGVGPFSDV